MDYTNITLGELLSSENDTIKRNAVSILKQLQKKESDKPVYYYGDNYIQFVKNLHKWQKENNR